MVLLDRANNAESDSADSAEGEDEYKPPMAEPGTGKPRGQYSCGVCGFTPKTSPHNCAEVLNTRRQNAVEQWKAARRDEIESRDEELRSGSRVIFRDGSALTGTIVYAVGRGQWAVRMDGDKSLNDKSLTIKPAVDLALGLLHPDWRQVPPMNGKNEYFYHTETRKTSWIGPLVAAGGEAKSPRKGLPATNPGQRAAAAAQFFKPRRPQTAEFHAEMEQGYHL